MAIDYGKRASGRRVTLNWSGLPEMEQTLKKALVDALDDRSSEVKAVLLPPSQAAMEKARNLAPVLAKATTQREPGTLRNAIIVTTGRSNYRGVLMKVDKNKAFYGGFVEYGTSKMQAKPYFRPAINQMKSTYVDDIAPGLKKLVESAAQKNAHHEQP